MTDPDVTLIVSLMMKATPEELKEMETLMSDALKEVEALEMDNTRLRMALVKLRDCDWVISLPDRMDAVRDIARAALRDAAA